MIQKDLVIEITKGINSGFDVSSTSKTVIHIMCSLIIKRDGKLYEVPLRTKSEYKTITYGSENLWEAINDFMILCKDIDEKWKLTGEFEKEVVL